ncbi:hypothetical protein GQ464_005420 [Rhodocaloribacter litoris]|uniref:DUF5687 family protein n=1 Tax=Rhodocaloribacter litoris TaxID=2558931 RepID=UPI0014241FB8|nr:DUF5687 family protein [Rhodocaloribacter litoris]QXD16390.1 hypothetical protein GQ464_005420 [Rhodocaloribacter litoris]
MPAFATYRLLTRNQWRIFLRSLRARQNLFVWSVFGIMGLYLGLTLITLGLYFERFAGLLAPSGDPVTVVNTYLLPVFIGLFGLRFLFQQTPALRFQPYLHLPIERARLVRFFQATSLLSLHNVYPLLFFVPFWSRHVAGHYPAGGAAAWLLGVLLALAASNFANLLVRSVLTRHEGRFLLGFGVLLSLIYLDELLGTRYVQVFSAYLFGGLLAGETTVLLLVTALPVWMVLASNLMLLQRLHGGLYLPRSGTAVPARRTRRLPLLERAGLTGRLILLELRLIWRNRRPRHYLLLSLLFSTLYLVFLLANPSPGGDVILGGIIGLFASGGFVLNHGQLMFSWESSHFDGLLVRPLPARALIRAKLLLLQASCLLLFVASLPLFLWLKPALVKLHLAFLFYNAGITTVLVMLLALRNRQPVDLARSGAFFNYEGFSTAHWLWFFPTALPPSIALFALRDTPDTGLLLLGGLGLIGLLATPLWISYFASRFEQCRLRMAEGFRRRRTWTPCT